MSKPFANLSTSVERVIAYLFDHVPEEQRSASRQNVLHSLVDQHPEDVLALLCGQSSPSSGLDLVGKVYELLSSSYSIPSSFINLFSMNIADEKESNRPAREQVTPKEGSTPSVLTRRQNDQLRKELLNGSFKKGIYARYGCENMLCKKCRYIYTLYPVSKCCKVHSKGEPCNSIGIYPHISKTKWERLHNLRSVPEKYPLGPGSYTNPLGLKSHAQFGRLICKHVNIPLAAVATKLQQQHTEQKSKEDPLLLSEVSVPVVEPKRMETDDQPVAAKSDVCSTVASKPKRKRRKASSTAPESVKVNSVPGMPSVSEAFRMFRKATSEKSEGIAHGLLMEALQLEYEGTMGEVTSQVYATSSTKQT